MNKFKMRFGVAPKAGWDLKLIDRYFEVLPKTGNYTDYVKKYTDFLVDYVDDQIDGKEWLIRKWVSESMNEGVIYVDMLPIHFTVDILDYTKYKYDNNMDEVLVLAQIMNRSKYKKDLFDEAVNSFYYDWIRQVEKYTKEIEKSTSVKLTKDESEKINKYVLYKNKAILKQLESDMDFISKTLKTFMVLQSNNKSDIGFISKTLKTFKKLQLSRKLQSYNRSDIDFISKTFKELKSNNKEETVLENN